MRAAWCFVAIFVWLWVNYGWAIASENALILLAFIANGLIAYALAKDRSDRRWVAYLVVAVDAVLLGFALLAPGRTYPVEWPWPTVLRQPSFLYFLLLPAIAALSFRPADGALVGLLDRHGLGHWHSTDPAIPGRARIAAANRWLCATVSCS